MSVIEFPRELLAEWSPLEERPIVSGNSHVWKVSRRNGESDCAVALKILHRLDRRDRFRQEARALDTLRSSPDCPMTIVELIASHIPDEGECFLFMPWHGNGTLESRAIHDKRYRGDVDSGLQILLDLAKTVRFLHGQSLAPMGYVAHRDLKPSNVLFDDTELPILTDFGCVAFDERLTETHETVGSRGYAAPEMLNGPYHGDMRPADIFSLGALTYAVMSGQHAPVYGNTLDPEFNLVSILDDPRALRIAQLVSYMMQQVPSSRPDADSVIRQFQELMEVPSQATVFDFPDLASALQLVQFDPRVVGRAGSLRSYEEIRGLCDVISSKCDAIWRAIDPIDLFGGPSLMYTLHSMSRLLDTTSVARVLDIFEAPKWVYRSDALQRVLAMEYTVAGVATVVFTPSKSLGDDSPEVTGLIALIVDRELSTVTVLSLAWCRRPESRLHCDWSVPPICFMRHHSASDLESNVLNLAKRLPSVMCTGVNWGMQFFIERSALPIAPTDPETVRAEWVPWNRRPEYLRVLDSAHRVFKECSSEVVGNRKGQFALYRGSQVQIFDPVNERETAINGISGGHLVLGSSAEIAGWVVGGGQSSHGQDTQWGGLYLSLASESQCKRIYYCGNRELGRPCFIEDDRTLLVPHGPSGMTGPYLTLLSVEGKIGRKIWRGLPGERVDYCAVGPNESEVYFTIREGRNGLWTISFDSGSDAIRIYEGFVTNPVVSPKGDRVAFCGSRDSFITSLYVSNLDGSDLLEFGRVGHGLCWSPGGEGLLYVTSDVEGSALYYIPIPDAG